MVADGRDRFLASKAKARSAGRETRTTAGRKLLRAAITPMVPAVTKLKRVAKSGKVGVHHREVALGLKGIPAGMVAAITCRIILDGIGQPIALRELADVLGRMVDDERRFLAAKKKAKRLGLALEATLRKGRNWFEYDAGGRSGGLLPRPVDRVTRHRVGLSLISQFCKLTGLATVETHMVGYHKRRTIVEPTRETLEWLDKAYANSESLFPVRRPIVEPPRPWTTPWDGGYHDLPNSFARQREFRTTSFPDDELPRIPAEAVNHLQTPRWRINPAVARVVEQAWEKGLAIGSLVSAEDEDPGECPEGLEGSALRAWRYAANRTYARNRAAKHKRMTALSIMSRARDLMGREFYFPWSCDFRGRMYPLATVLTPQSGDLARSLLEFAEGKPIGKEADSLWRWGLQTWGKQEVDLHLLSKAVATDPLGQREQWVGAKEPWRFLAWCFEWARHQEEKHDLVTHLPCWIDGTANALQCYALLLRDERMAEQTNVVDTGERQDPYEVVTRRAWELLEEESSEHPVRQWLRNFPDGPPRELTKVILMPIIYGGSLTSAERGGVFWLERTMRTDIMLEAHNTRSTSRLAYMFWLAFKECFPGFFELRSWLRALGREAAKADSGMTWTSPSGFPVCSSYSKSRARVIRTTFMGRMRHVTLRDFDQDLDPKLCGQALPANFIHSLDAAALAYALRDLSVDRIQVASAHDGLGMLAPDIPRGHRAIRAGFAWAFGGDPLADLVASLGVRKRLPVRGDLDVSRVMQAPHFFS